MARWSIRRRADGHLELEYLRPGVLGVFRAGTVHGWTSAREILRWIIEQDATTTGDIITLPNGCCVQLLRAAPGMS